MFDKTAKIISEAKTGFYKLQMAPTKRGDDFLRHGPPDSSETIRSILASCRAAPEKVDGVYNTGSDHRDNYSAHGGRALLDYWHTICWSVHHERSCSRFSRNLDPITKPVVSVIFVESRRLPNQLGGGVNTAKL